MKYITRSEADTMAFAGCIAEMLTDGDTVLLHGDLGAGKSVFARTGRDAQPDVYIDDPISGKARAVPL